MKRLSKSDESLLGQECLCENCKAVEGVLCIDPYYENVHQEQILACYCPSCYDRIGQVKLKEKLEQEPKAKNTDECGIEKVEEIIKVFMAHKRLYDRMRLKE